MNTPADTTHSPPAMEAASADHLQALRTNISTHENKLEEARANQRWADMEIEQMEQKLAGWRKYRTYQAKREVIFTDRIRSDRAQLRMEEDYASGIE